MKFRLISLCLLLLLPLTAQAQQTEVPQAGTAMDHAAEIVQMFISGNYAGIYAQCSDQIKAAVTQDQLGQAWEGIIKSEGAFQQIANVQADEATHAVIQTLQFEKGILDLHTTFDADGKITGLGFAPSASAPTQVAPTPTYADSSSFTETPVTVGDFKAPGTITMPNGAGPFPAVVLISGSGPNDQDETIGPNKPFRDIAWGLASQGIATLRFDKRTRIAAAVTDLSHFTVKEEYVDDSVAAVELMRATTGIDPARVFILGHSEGGFVAPRIVKADSNIAGVIIAAGLANPLPETILRQTRYLVGLQVQTPEATEDPAITQIEDVVKQINALTADSPAGQLVFHAPPSYWLDLRGYDPVALEASLPQPVLVLQGGRDYQVTVADDLPLWQAGLADHKDVTFKTYPDLNHLFETGTGMSTPAEYNQPGNVAPEVINDVAAWVKAH